MKFTPEQRERIKSELIEKARADESIISAAVFGSSAKGEEDEWSDIDLGLRVADGEDAAMVCENWTAFMREAYPVADTLDVWAQGALYRVFLLDCTLQVDLSFWPHDRFTIIGPHYRLLFGEASFANTPPADIGQIIGAGWLYILHARSYIARGRRWQAMLMLEELRNRIFMLMCARHAVDYAKGRGIELLPEGEAAAVHAQMPKTPCESELRRAFSSLCDMYLRQVGAHDASTAGRLAVPVDRMRRFAAGE